MAKLKEKLKRKVEREIEKAEKKREKSPLVKARTSFTFVPAMKTRRGMTERDGTREEWGYGRTVGRIDIGTEGRREQKNRIGIDGRIFGLTDRRTDRLSGGGSDEPLERWWMVRCPFQIHKITKFGKDSAMELYNAMLPSRHHISIAS